MTPVEALRLNPAGRPVAAQVYGVLPPVAASVRLYATPTTPSGREAVVMASCGVVVNERLAVAVRCVGEVESVTVTDTVLVPAVVGVPVIAPVEALIDRPVGRPVAAQV